MDAGEDRVGEDMDVRAGRTEDYVQAQVRVFDVFGRVLLLEPREPGPVHDTFPFADGLAHVLTACDPGPRRLDPAENARRQAALVAELPAHVRRWAAVAGAADGSHEEASVLVVGLSDDQARKLGSRWDQDAIFRWDAASWTVLPCDEAAPVDLGWRLRTPCELRPGSVALSRRVRRADGRTERHAVRGRDGAWTTADGAIDRVE